MGVSRNGKPLGRPKGSKTTKINKQAREGTRWVTVDGGDPYENLANAIIAEAVRDYKKTLKALQRNPRSVDLLHDAAELEKFFRGKWFGQLTTLDGEYIIRRAKEICRSGATVGVHRGRGVSRTKNK